MILKELKDALNNLDLPEDTEVFINDLRGDEDKMNLFIPIERVELAHAGSTKYITLACQGVKLV